MEESSDESHRGRGDPCEGGLGEVVRASAQLQPVVVHQIVQGIGVQERYGLEQRS